MVNPIPLTPFPWEGKGEEKGRGAFAPLGLPYLNSEELVK